MITQHTILDIFSDIREYNKMKIKIFRMMCETINKIVSNGNSELRFIKMSTTKD